MAMDVTAKIQLRVQHSRPRPDLHVCTVIGEVDLCTLPVLERALAEFAGAPVLVVDLSRVEFLSATGVSTLLAAAMRAGRHRRRFALVATTRPVCRVLSLTGVGSYRSLPEALREHGSAVGGDR